MHFLTDAVVSIPDRSLHEFHSFRDEPTSFNRIVANQLYDITLG